MTFYNKDTDNDNDDDKNNDSFFFLAVIETDKNFV